MTQLKDDLLNWVISEAYNLGFSEVESIVPLREQASLRNYFRIKTDIGSYVGVISDPESDMNLVFTNYSKFFIENNIKVPRVEAHNHQKGFLLLEDFGDKVLQLEINTLNIDSFIQSALKQIALIQECESPRGAFELSEVTLIDQMYLFEHWLLGELINFKLSGNEKKIIDNAYKVISKECMSQEQYLCHFDFEFRNLMLLNDGAIGILDFQDLCKGPYALDLVSILKDIENPLTNGQIQIYLNFFCELAQVPKTISRKALSDLIRDVDFAGFQRQLRILGTLSRLHIRDKKSFRLNDLIQTLDFLIDDSKKYHQLDEFNHLLIGKVKPNLIAALKDIK